MMTVLLAALTLCACQETLEERCAREAKAYTEKHCPLRVQENIVMDSMTFDMQTHTIGYAYTLSGVLDDTAVVNRTKPYELLLTEVKNSTNLKLYKEAGYNFRYTYHSAGKPKAILFDATYTPKDYQ